METISRQGARGKKRYHHPEGTTVFQMRMGREEKVALGRLADEAGMSITGFVLWSTGIREIGEVK